MTRRGNRVDWLVQSDCDSTFKKTSLGNGCAYIAPTDNGTTRWHRFKKHIYDLTNDSRILGLVKRNKYDVIQVKDKYLSAIPAIIIAKIFNIKFFYWIAFPCPEASIYIAKARESQYWIFYWVRGHFLRFILYRLIMPFSDHIFVQSEQMKRDIHKEGIENEKMTPIQGSLNLNNVPFQAGSDKFGDDGSKNIVYVGTLNRMRKLDFMLNVFAKVLKKVPDAKLFIIGDGDDPEDKIFLQTEAKKLGIGQSIVFTGFIAMEKAWKYIEKASVCISPYYPTPILLSTSPTKLIEYMSMGKAVVGNEHPEQECIINDSGAGICVPWNERSFSKAVIHILTNPKLAKKMGRNGRLYVEKYRTNQCMADLVENTYLKFLNRQKNVLSADLQ